MFPIRTVLHPTDFTEHSTYAFHVACALARDYSAKLVVLHVYPTPVYPIADGGLFPVPGEVPREQLLAELKEMKPRDPKIPVGHALVEGEPAFETLRAAEAYDADLIVMGTHGRGGLSRLVMGSVAEAVARKAGCPVLTVRMPVGERRLVDEREPVGESHTRPVKAAHEELIVT
jgi:nucleotide-binding universal stress UspA family protein